MSLEEEKEFNETVNCYYCGGVLGCVDQTGSLRASLDKVRDHDHFNGKYRGAAHNKCNLNAKKPKFVPLYFYNGSKYDNHLFIKEQKIKELYKN